MLTLIGTLAGTVVGSATAVLVAYVGRRAARVDGLVQAVAALVAALDAHRAAMQRREELRLLGGGRGDVRQTRAAVSAPLATVCLLAPWLAEVAEAAAQATYDMRGAPDKAELNARREAAKAMSRWLLYVAGRRLAVRLR